MPQLNVIQMVSFGVLALGIGWTAYGTVQFNRFGDIFTDNTLGLGIVTMVMALFILRAGRRLRRRQ